MIVTSVLVGQVEGGRNGLMFVQTEAPSCVPLGGLKTRDFVISNNGGVETTCKAYPVARIDFDGRDMVVRKDGSALIVNIRMR